MIQIAIKEWVTLGVILKIVPKFHEPYYTFKQYSVIMFMLAKNNFKKSQIIKKKTQLDFIW